MAMQQTSWVLAGMRAGLDAGDKANERRQRGERGPVVYGALQKEAVRRARAYEKRVVKHSGLSEAEAASRAEQYWRAFLVGAYMVRPAVEDEAYRAAWGELVFHQSPWEQWQASA